MKFKSLYFIFLFFLVSNSFAITNSEIKYVIKEYLIKNNQLQKALELSESWVKERPYDFSGKFQYSKVLALIDKNEAKKYLEQLYKKHYDIQEVYDALQIFLIENGSINEAIRMNYDILWGLEDTAYYIDGRRKDFNAR